MQDYINIELDNHRNQLIRVSTLLHICTVFRLVICTSLAPKGKQH